MNNSMMAAMSNCKYTFGLCNRVTHKNITLSCIEELFDKEVQHLFRILLRDVCSGGHELYRKCLSNVDDCYSGFYSEKLFNACCLTYLRRCEARIRILEVFAEAFESREKLLSKEARTRSTDPSVIDAVMDDSTYSQIYKKRKTQDTANELSD